MVRFNGLRLLPAAAALFGCLWAEAKVELAPVFSDRAVFQRDMAVPVWGTAEPGEKVTVKFAGQSLEATAGTDGKWMVSLAPMAASKENRTLEAAGKENTVKADNILVGEVWIASGQSNMEWSLRGHRNAAGNGTQVAEKTNLPLIRFIRMDKAFSEQPVDKVKVVWSEAVNGNELLGASAIGFFFARELFQTLDVPVGIIGAYWGGTRIEPWTPPEGFDAVPGTAEIARRVNSKIAGTQAYKETGDKVVREYTAWLNNYRAAIAAGNPPPEPPAFPSEQRRYENQQQPTVLYNRMLHTFIPYAVRGGIWYQGESNLGDRMAYCDKMKALLAGWKSVFRNPDLKFHFAQLAPFTYGNPMMLPELWEAQQRFADDTGSGMAVITDAVHNIKDIHPTDKEVVGKRLAWLALNRDYGKKEIKAESPRLAKHQIEGNAFVLDFNFVESWKPEGDQPIPYFEVAGIDGEFFPAKAEIRGKQLVVSSDKVAKPTSLRYMWLQTCEGKLANEAGLILGSFRIQSGDQPTADELLAYFKDTKKLVFEYNLKSGSGFGDKTKVNYAADNSAEVKDFRRVTYLAILTGNDDKVTFVAASMDAFTKNAAQLGVPVKSAGATFQTRVKNLAVLSNVPGVSGQANEGNIEFWPHNYGPGNAANVPGADGGKYDFGDQKNDPQVGYGSMQIHNFGARQTVFAYNNFGAGANADIGIGNNSNGQPDWTFSGAGKNYKKATLYVFVSE